MPKTETIPYLPFYAHLRRIDPQSAELLLSLMGTIKLDASVDTSLLWKAFPNLYNLYLVLDSTVLPARSKYVPPVFLIRVSLQNISRTNYGYGERGFIDTTLMISSIIDNISLYFQFHTKKKVKSSYKSFSKNCEQGFSLRKSLFQFNSKQDANKPSPLSSIANKIVHYHRINPALLEAPGLGGLVLKVAFHCGKKSNARDQKNLSQLQSLLKQSSNMKEFLTAFTGSIVSVNDNLKNKILKAS